MVPRLALALLLATALRGCIHYEYEHEFWLRVDGSGTVNVTGRPALWTAFKSLPLDERDPEGMMKAARELFESSGLRCAAWTSCAGAARLPLRDGRLCRRQPAVVHAGLPGPARRAAPRGGRLQLDGSWQRPLEALEVPGLDREGLLAVRFHLPSKVYAHRNAFEGIERGNILAWRGEVTRPSRRAPGARRRDGRAQHPLLDGDAVRLAVVAAVAAARLGLWAVARRGRRDLARCGVSARV